MSMFNLWLKECGKDTYQVVFSSPPENEKTGLALKWPVDPEFTGETGIICMLYQHGGIFAGKKFKHSKLGIVSGYVGGIHPLV